MTYGEEQHELMRRTVEQLFRDVASRFEHASVRTDAPGPAGNNLPELRCSLPGTASITALPGADQIDLYLGKNTWFEVLPSRRKRPAMDFVSEVVEAVVAGRFEEHLRGFGGMALGSMAVFHQLGEPSWQRSIRARLWRLAPGRKTVIRYRPYG